MRSFVQLVGIAAAAILLSSLRPAQADVTWTLSGTGDWSVATDWSGGLPTSSTNADIYNGGTATITTTGDACYVLSLGNSAGSGSIEMTSGNLSVYNSAFIGYAGVASFAQTAGHCYLSSAYLGYNFGASAPYTLGNSGQLRSYLEWLGYWGAGTFIQSL